MTDALENNEIHSHTLLRIILALYIVYYIYIEFTVRYTYINNNNNNNSTNHIYKYLCVRLRCVLVVYFTHYPV